MKEIVNCDMIRGYITENGLTVKEFCKQCGVGASTFYRIMNGGEFNLDSIYKITKRMNVPMHMIFKRASESPTKTDREE